MTPKEKQDQLDRMEFELDSWRPNIRYIPLGWPPDGNVEPVELCPACRLAERNTCRCEEEEE